MSGLSEREREVLRLLSTASTADEIAQRLSISVSTARDEIRALYRKLGVDARHEAVLRWRDLEQKTSD